MILLIIDAAQSRTLLDESNAAYAKKHVQRHLCNARNDDPAGRTIRLLEEAQATMGAYDHDHAESESAQSRQGKRREWALKANMAKVWHEESAAKWITSYMYIYAATQA